VEVVVKADNFAIRATAEALQSGSAGDEIWVRLRNNGKRMRAVVLGPAQVAIY
jgi:flagella basal body P-ring formation protein FlgA